MTWPNHPTDRTGRLTIGPDTDEQVQGWYVRRRGDVVGVYYDDTTPQLTRWLALARAKYELVFVAVSMSAPHKRWPGCVNLQEWYPIASGYPASAWGPLPGDTEGYIVQDRYPGFKGTYPPSRLSRLALLARVLLKRPKYIFLF